VTGSELLQGLMFAASVTRPALARSLKRVLMDSGAVNTTCRNWLRDWMRCSRADRRHCANFDGAEHVATMVPDR